LRGSLNGRRWREETESPTMTNRIETPLNKICTHPPAGQRVARLPRMARVVQAA